MKQACLAAFLLTAGAALAPACADESNPWNGLYVGLHGGYSWQDLSGTFDDTNLSDLSINGAIVGGQLGYNWQSGQFLLGIEGDASTLVDGDTVTNDATDVTYESLTGDISYLASIRGRIGWAINNWLLYGTGGWGFSKFEFTEDAPNAPGGPFTGKIRLKDNGAVYGGGVEVMLAYGVSLRAEYLRYDLGASTSISTNFEDADPGDRISFDNIDVARAALNIKLSP